MSPPDLAPWIRRLGLGLLAGLALVLILTLAGVIALLGLHRFSADLEPARAAQWLWYFRADPLVRRWSLTGLFSAGLLVGLAAIALLRPRPPALHGQARLARSGDLAASGLRARSGVILGRFGGQRIVLGGSEHVLVYAPTRSGKGAGIVIPNLLTWPQAVVVLDVKQENWAATAGYRASLGQKVLLFDPLARDGRTARFNPLGHIGREDPMGLIDELQKIAEMLFPLPENADPFWAEAARTGFVGVGGLIAETPEKPFSLGAIYETLTLGDPRVELPKILEQREAAHQPLSPVFARAIADFCSASDKTFASIKQTITARMHLFLNPRVCAATEASDFDLRGLADQSIAIYLGVSPDNLGRVAPLYNLMFQLLVDLNTRTPPSGPQRDRQVLVLLDEFARLGHAGVLARSFSYVAGYGLRLVAILQSPAQLRAAYGAELAEEITTNCGAEVAFGVKTLNVARDLSERIGAYTYEAFSFSGPSGLSSGRRTQSRSGQRRALLLPQEILQLPAHALILLRAGLPPVLGQRISYWRERDFKARLLPPPLLPARPEVLHPKVRPAAWPDPAVRDAHPRRQTPSGAADSEAEIFADQQLEAMRRRHPRPDRGRPARTED
ncbi:type IV secretory system conjugative DNA transfer family protein [Phenylobacterium aquaticum]|uniref:type IV secretory system conjugative DNA transfer family protein n=1 Tax=Phenylobacterium aquaticum TaxID=1763816 RepID=UPI001F5C2D2A|nr:type IV secretory system conjugative DNA transfer family protein [Phenylobacterium aquaticum]MCI3135377.1 type IV secretory system conjugative DNA transfer family protein [Phenylobacterium aquaticum]